MPAHDGPALRRDGLVLQHRPQLLAQLRTVLMPVYRNGVLYSCLDQFLLAVGAQCERAIHFTGISSTIDVLAAHDVLLEFTVATQKEHRVADAAPRLYAYRRIAVAAPP